MPLDQLSSAFLRELAVTGVSKSTLRSYEASFRRFLAWCKENKIARPRQITFDVLVDFHKSLRDEGLATATVEKISSPVRNWRRWLGHRGHAPEIPVLPTVKNAPAKLPFALSRTQIDTLIATPQSADWPLGKGIVEATHIGIRDRAILEVLYSTGCRVAELCGMDKGDLDLRGGVIRVMGKGKKERLVPLGTHARRALKKYLDHHQRPIAYPGHGRAVFLSLVGLRVQPKTVQRIVEVASERAGFEMRVTPHTIRHTFATHLLRAGAPLTHVSKLLGHASVSTTMIYTHLANNDIMDAFDRYHPRAGDSNHRDPVE